MDPEKRLAALERSNERIIVLLETLTEKVESRIGASDSWRARVERTLNGDGNGNKGMYVRLDRLEQNSERSKWVVRSIGLPVLLLIAKSALDLLQH